MNNYKYKTLEDALNDAIGSAISDKSQCHDGNYFDDCLLAGKFDDAIDQAIKNILDTECIEIRFKEEQ